MPIQYATWWGQVESCSGVRGNFDAVKWYFTLGALDVAGQNYDGFWWQQGNRIALTWTATLRGGTVRHEMLHALLQTGAHPPAFFITRCGALAPCGTACGLREDERGVPASARQIPSESLTVAVSVAPSGAPAIAIDSGWMTIMVTATNTRPEPVWVSIPDSAGFGYGLLHSAGQLQWTSERQWAFLAGESRSVAFDVQLGPPQMAIGATDSLWGTFGHAGSRPLAIRLLP